MKRIIFFIVILLLINISVEAQKKFLKLDNKTDNQGRRQGKWSILLDKNFQVTTHENEVAYYL